MTKMGQTIKHFHLKINIKTKTNTKMPAKINTGVGDNIVIVISL